MGRTYLPDGNQGTTIDVWGGGTKLVTAYDQPALGGVYKLTAVRSADGAWQDRIKLSEETVKVTNPDIPQSSGTFPLYT